MKIRNELVIDFELSKKTKKTVSILERLDKKYLTFSEDLKKVSVEICTKDYFTIK